MHRSALTEDVPPSLARAAELESPYGLVSRSAELPQAAGEPVFAIWTAFLGDLSAALDSQRVWRHRAESGNIDGAGGAIDADRARHIAIVESMERYSSCAWSEDELIWDTAAGLGEGAIGPEHWPVCSPTELADPHCGLRDPDPRVPIRWVRGWSLTRGREVFVPAILAYLNFPLHSPSEFFTNPVSTGTAAHADLREAVLGGLLEVIERDSISLTWLQRLRLPRVEVDPDALDAVAAEYHRVGTSTGLEVHLFDATTDYGVPVLYAVQTSSDDTELAQVVAATCDLDPQRALAKIYRELASLRIALRSYARNPRSKKEVTDQDLTVVGGALANADPQMRHVFDFLLQGPRPVRPLSQVGALPEGGDPLERVVSHLERAGAEAIVVDLTTDEARQVGMHVIKALIPQAMPLSFSHRARFLATPRLYQAPRAMGLEVHEEKDINPVKQPFA
ncbi:YcaO-like family protein [Actinomyces slackii]|uniref:Bacteriocin biosynthesis docking scaffold, SagD family n=1 Tax=Actinomyces slackii TaxID=52774 RepID=A0A448KAD7_9ACTO|nr:YcaO-like family protein [Actinomyces slackii]VEG73872.1 bacteriocin biosynthesis docking scaffold, SagD family [Actinomyces slackii]